MGVRNVTGNDAMDVIPLKQVPLNKEVAYANMVCDIRPHKTEKYRVRLTIGGDVLEYLGDATSPAVSLIETKMILNSVISDAAKGARFMTIDIKDYFLQSILEEPEFLRIHYRYFFDDIKKKYNIDSIVASDGFVYCRIKKDLYGLKQAARLARGQLIKHLRPHGHTQCEHSRNIWKHNSRRTCFCLCVHDFAIKYYSQEDADHLLSALKEAYEITVDHQGENSCE